MTSALLLVAAIAAHDGGQNVRQGPFILPPGPYPGWSFPATSADGLQWHPIAPLLPICERDPWYYFPSHHAIPPIQAFFPTYYNPFTTRNQAYIPYSCFRPRPLSSHPYEEQLNSPARTPVPSFTGREEAKPINPSSVELTPH